MTSVDVHHACGSVVAAQPVLATDWTDTVLLPLQGCQNAYGVPYGDKPHSVSVAGELLQSKPDPKGRGRRGPSWFASALGVLAAAVGDGLRNR